MTCRTYKYPQVEASVSHFLTGFFLEAAGLRLGELTGLASVAAAAADFRGAAVRDNVVADTARVSDSGVSPARFEASRNDHWSFSCSMHVLACCSGSWAARWLETGFGAPLVRLINPHVSPALKLPLDLAPRGPISPILDGVVAQTQEQPGRISWGTAVSVEGRKLS